ncbi:MAG: S41 family peptidase [Nitrospina sp.]|nr:MAG: S41 family peptidase [Nitrospina sp.]
MQAHLAVLFVFTFLLLPLPNALAQEAEAGEGSKSENTYEKLKVFSEILSLLESNYVEEVNSDDLVEGAIRGLLKTLDPHTSYLPPASYKQMQVETSGKFGGLGIEISMRKGILTVISPIEDTPAFKAGILAGDRIIKIEDESTLDITLSEAVNLLRGDRGAPIKITIFREGMEEPKDYTIVRDVINVRSLTSKIYNSDVGYIKIRNFTKTTSNDLDKALAVFESKNVRRLVLDLRNNPGGLLNQAVEVADRFLDDENLIVYTQGRTEDQNMRFTTHDRGRQVSYPMIILVNGGSASASEIVAGALQDLGRAVILGTQTFGKGSVQTIIPLSEGSALRLTTARYYTPSGKVIQENGITPDIIVEMPPVVRNGQNNEKKKNGRSLKDKIRKILREKDLKKHLKGKKSIEGSVPSKNTDKTDEINKELIALREEIEKDPQLKQAINLLKGWSVMSKSYINKK